MANPFLPNPENPPAVIIGLDCMTGLQTARLLAAQGIPVVSLARDRRHHCCRTRACCRIEEVDPSSDRLVPALNRLAPDLGPRAVLFPCTDMSVYQLAARQDDLDPRYCRDLPSLPVVETLMDKAKCQRHASELGLAVPQTFLLSERAAAERAAAAATFPCVLKPAIKDLVWEHEETEKAFLLEGPAQLLAAYDRVARHAGVLVLQEWIQGDDTSLFTCNCFFDSDSQPRAICVTQKIRQWPPRIGISCLSITTENDAVTALTVRLFQSLRYRGLAYAEVKQDPRTGKYLFIEANVGRPTGRSAMAEACGIPLLYTKYCDSLGRALPAPRTMPAARVKWIHWRRDMQAAFLRWREGRLTVGEWLRSLRGVNAYAILDWRDPLPVLGEILYAIRKTLRRIRGRTPS